MSSKQWTSVWISVKSNHPSGGGQEHIPTFLALLNQSETVPYEIKWGGWGNPSYDGASTGVKYHIQAETQFAALSLGREIFEKVFVKNEILEKCQLSLVQISAWKD